MKAATRMFDQQIGDEEQSADDSHCGSILSADAFSGRTFHSIEFPYTPKADSRRPFPYLPDMG